MFDSPARRVGVDMSSWPLWLERSSLGDVRERTATRLLSFDLVDFDLADMADWLNAVTASYAGAPKQYPSRDAG